MIGLVAAELGIPASALVARSRCRAEIAEARWLAMYLAHVVLGRSIDTLARLFRRNWSTVSRACMRLEDQRDRPEFDALLDRLERVWIAREERPAPSRARRRG
jgi:chromosomal replication initiation ATPase DnaA